ncbi:MAG TPA: phage holin family protein, partial [Baekduia sp.]|nr:phage holin family protein [Baekduia sp.]
MSWQPSSPKLRPLRLALAWGVSAAAVWVTAWMLPGFSLGHSGAAVTAALAIALLNAVLPPVLAALRLPYMLITGFLLVLVADALVLQGAAALLADEDVHIAGFGDALLAALVITAVSMVLQIILGTNDDDDEYSLRVTRRIAKRQGASAPTDVPGILFLEIDGLGLPILRAAMRDGSAPSMARWIARDGYRLAEWETDLSSQTGASQAGILLGSNDDIPAFRWVEKEAGRMMVCSSPEDCAEIERRHATGVGLLVDGGASRGNLLSGEAEETILTVSRADAERGPNPGYRAFLANGFNVTRTLVLFWFEVGIEVTSALRAARRDVRPRGHRGGSYPFLRAALCVFVRDLIVHGVLTDMMRGRPAVYATFSSYDEVAHHSGLQRVDTMEALRKLDQQFGRISRARRYAPRPYEIVVLSDHGQTQGATFKQRNGYGLDELVKRSLSGGEVAEFAGGDEQSAMAAHALGEATGRDSKKPAKNDVSGRDVVVLGSGNLGLVYLMQESRRLTLEEIEEGHPNLITALREHPHVGWL